MAALANFAKYVRPAVPGCPEPVLLDAILRACIEFCARTEILTETVSLNTVADTAAYTVTPTAGLVADKLLRVWRDTDDDLDPSSRLGFEADGIDTRSGAPTDCYLEGNDLLMLGPIPEAVETLSVKVSVRPADNATSVPDVLYSRWAKPISAGAKAILHGMKNTAWHDPNEAVAQDGLFREAIDQANLQRATGLGRKRLRVTAHWC